jgi:cytochrome d ubiquinol oxidase subunit II
MLRKRTHAALRGVRLPLLVGTIPVAGYYRSKSSGISACCQILTAQRPGQGVGSPEAATVVFGWGWAQYPWLIPGRLSLAEGSAPGGTLTAELVVAVRAGIIVVPSFGYLYWLQQHGRLEDGDH